jgi:cephalosporin-C deacetylase-like acetyl esterase
MTLSTETKLTHYEISAQIGRGGMGKVYQAKDTKLGRDVAIKVLPEEFARDTDRVARFQREAKLLASLNHPNIAAIYGLEESEGVHFLVMELIEGQTLADRIKTDPIPVEESLKLALQIALALQTAHKKGIIHRDLKPSNIMVTDESSVKLLDFGLAKLYEKDASVSGLSTADMTASRTGGILGTVAYMSPEQAQGQVADERSDIFAFGLVLYEMLSGKRAFSGDSSLAILTAIQKNEPAPLHTLPSLEKIVGRCLTKQPSARYQTMATVKTALEQTLAETSTGTGHVVDTRLLRQQVRRPRVFIPGLLTLIALCALVGWYTLRTAKVNWAKEQALPEITRLLDNRDYSAAYDLAIQAEKHISDDPGLTRLWPEMSALVSIQTTPPGADIYVREYSAVSDEWEYLGQSPLEKVRIPIGYFRWKISKAGYINIEHAASATAGGSQANYINLPLFKEGAAPQAMVQVPEGIFATLLARIGLLGPVQLGEYWIDKYEVTNRQFKEFVDQGGYEKREYWKNQFVKDGINISWERAMVEFRDATGRPGPAGWEAGGYPTDQEDFPVTGVSWYEAAAYAEFAGKRLPTICDWYKAADVSAGPFIVPLSNFGGQGPERVGAYQGVGPFGTYDMAGNVKEWCWNEDRGKHYILGGGWNEPTYMFGYSEPRDPFDRSSVNGFRCVKYTQSEPPPQLTASVHQQFRDFSSEQPVSDETFRIYESLYAYEWTELNPIIESEDDTSQYWRVQKVTFDAAYGNERVIAHLYLPKNKPAPYQTVIFFPGANSVFERSSPNAQTVRALDFLIKSGRAVLHPVYKGLYERGFDRWSGDPAAVRDRLIKWRKDLGRSIDYIQSRKDLDSQKLAYCGHSMGARTGAILLAVEKRLKTAILLDGGFPIGRMASDSPIPFPQLGGEQRPTLQLLPEADAINFAPRVRMPVLMLNGRYDFIFPVEASQIPMFRALGTPENLKQHVILDTPHNVFNAGSITIRHILDWLDQYLGPVKQ